MLITIVVGANFYDLTEAALVSAASGSCRCGAYDCYTCRCREEAVQRGLIAEEEGEE